MLLSVIVSRVEVKRGYELKIQLAPDFNAFLEGLIEMRQYFDETHRNAVR